ncbi:MAG: urease accessory protein UreD [Gemmatimonadales bacterium]
MHLAEPILASWKADLALRFEARGGRTVLAEKRFDGPLVVQKALHPEGDAVCHAIVVHPPGGIAGGDELSLEASTAPRAHALLTTPGAGKWYRSSGAIASQSLAFHAAGTLEWLPRETIVFDGAIARLATTVELGPAGAYLGWEIACLGRAGSGERFTRGSVHLSSRVIREGRLLWSERGRIDGGGALARSPAGLAGHTVFGTFVATVDAPQRSLVDACREHAAVTHLPGLLVARYLGDSSEEAFERFTRVWALLRPAVAGREAVIPRIWST